MSKAIGMIEFKTTATGVTAADAMVKTSDVEIVEAQTVCPGKYIAIITGDLSAVKAAVDTAVQHTRTSALTVSYWAIHMSPFSRQFMELLRLRRSVHWEFLKHMMQLPLLKLQTRLQRLQSLILLSFVLQKVCAENLT